MKHLRHLSFLSFFIVVLLGAPACKKKTRKVDEAAKNGILLYGNGTEPQGLDPHIVTGVPEHHIISALFEGLVELDPETLQPIPGVAESWEVSSNQRQFTFKLRKNAQWSNGEPLLAQDYVFSWKRSLAPEMGNRYAYMLYPVKNAERFNLGKIKDFNQVGIRAIDDHTLRVTLDGPTPYFLSILAHYSTFAVNQKVIEAFGKWNERGTKWTRPGNLVGNGPYQLADWKMNQVIRVVKNENYWDKDRVSIREIQFFPTENSDTEEKTFRAGGIHLANSVPLPKIETYRQKYPELLKIHAYLGSYFYRVNTKRPPLNDVRVRRALAMAIDREAIVKHVTQAGQIPAYYFTPPGMGGYFPKKYFEYDVKKAKQLLLEAGYGEGKKPFPKIEILYNTLEAHRQIAQAVQQMWKKNLGVEITLLNQDWKVYLDTEKKMNYDLSRGGWIGDYPDPNTFLDLFMSNGGNNHTGYSNWRYDKLIRKASLTGDQKERVEYFHQAEELLMESMPIIPVYIYTRVYLRHPHIEGWKDNVLDYHVYKFLSLKAPEVESE